MFVTKAGEVGSIFWLCVSSFVNFLINFMDFLLGENCAVQRCDSRCSAHGVCSNGESSFFSVVQHIVMYFYKVCSNGESSFFTYNNVCNVLYNTLSCTFTKSAPMVRKVFFLPATMLLILGNMTNRFRTDFYLKSIKPKEN